LKSSRYGLEEHMFYNLSGNFTLTSIVILFL